MPDVLHRERLWPSPATWLVVPLAGAFLTAVFLPLGAVAAVAGAVGGVLAVAGWLVGASALVEVSGEGGLRAGRARVPARFLAGGTAARGEQARQLRGPALDARTHLCLRGWVDGVVLVVLDDPEDPTPSWLLSTRRPEDLLAAVRRVSGAPASG